MAGVVLEATDGIGSATWNNGTPLPVADALETDIAMLDAMSTAGGLQIDRHADNTVVTAPADFEAVKNALEAAGLKPEVAEVTMRAENSIPLTGEDAARMQKLLDILEDLDDVQEVFHNAEINE